MADTNTAAQENTKPAKKGKDKKESFWSGVKKEWSKIIWLPAKTVGRQTGLVVVLSIIMGIIISVVDSGALRLIEKILSI
ncbi:MAG: preprotein translocase subunit SecE [Lachnospiraceae bacterium]|nr:preprotein translocase subunit SecE [Lachnospiraceae bacterium]